MPIVDRRLPTYTMPVQGRFLNSTIFVLAAVTISCFVPVQHAIAFGQTAATAAQPDDSAPSKGSGLKVPAGVNKPQICTPPVTESGKRSSTARLPGESLTNDSLRLPLGGVGAAEEPPATASVTYSKGQLSIRAQNASLLEVLHEVESKTGATFDLPSDCTDDRIFLNAGPAPVREVVTALLNGSKYNYIMVGSGDGAGDLKRVILTSAHTDGAKEAASGSAPPANPVLQRGVVADDQGAADEAQQALQSSAPSEHFEAPKQPLPGEVLEDMLRQRIEAREAQQNANPPTNPQ